MPIIKSAAKALRQTKKRTALNKTKAFALKLELRKFKKQKKLQDLAKIYQLVDKMAKTGLIHKNKAARIKSSASKLVSTQTIKKSASRLASVQATKKPAAKTKRNQS